MPNPLNREWLPDGERMRSTTAWILQREPLLVRVAPLVILGFVIALAAWAARARVDVYASIPASVSALPGRAADDTLLVRLDSEDARIAPGTPVVVIPAGGNARNGRVEASVVRLDHGSDGAPTAIIAVGPGARPLVPGRATVQVRTGQRALLSEFLASARGGRRAQ